MRSHLIALMAWVFYPLWLGAGAVDYVCHRRSAISHTSGVTESLFHVLQFALLTAALALAVLLEISLPVYGLMLTLVLTHSVCAYLDVRYTQGRRFISPLEQQVHGIMDVVPLTVVGILGALHWPSISVGEITQPLRIKQPIELSTWLLLCSFVILSGGPVFEEWLRTRHAARST